MITCIYFRTIVVLDMEGVVRKLSYSGEESSMYPLFWLKKTMYNNHLQTMT